MPCLACGAPGFPICVPCRRSLRRPPERAVGDGVVVSGVWSHHGAARRLVQRLKYDGVTAVAGLAAATAPPPPPGVSALVPVPRVLTRRLAHGIDPAVVFAAALGNIWDLPVLTALAAPMWAPRRAGRRHRGGPPAFRLVAPVPDDVMVVDDVVTSGGTVGTAARLLGVRRAFALTVVAGVRAPGTLAAAGPNPPTGAVDGIRCLPGNRMNHQ